MNKQTDELFDNVDAVFFSGDSLFSPEAIQDAQYYLDRWVKQLEHIRQIVSEI